MRKPELTYRVHELELEIVYLRQTLNGTVVNNSESRDEDYSAYNDIGI